MSATAGSGSFRRRRATARSPRSAAMPAHAQVAIGHEQMQGWKAGCARPPACAPADRRRRRRRRAGRAAGGAQPCAGLGSGSLGRDRQRAADRAAAQPSGARNNRCRKHPGRSRLRSRMAQAIRTLRSGSSIISHTWRRQPHGDHGPNLRILVAHHARQEKHVRVLGGDRPDLEIGMIDILADKLAVARKDLSMRLARWSRTQMRPSTQRLASRIGRCGQSCRRTAGRSSRPCDRPCRLPPPRIVLSASADRNVGLRNGQTSAHCGLSNEPSHSVHLAGSMMLVSPFILIAAFGIRIRTRRTPCTGRL